MAGLAQIGTRALVRRGLVVEYLTLGWNVVSVVVLLVAAWAAKSVALAGLGLRSLVEICASIVMVWTLAGHDQARQHLARRLIGAAYLLLAIYLLVQATLVLIAGIHPAHSNAGMGWTAVTAPVLLGLGATKARTGVRLNHPTLRAQGRITRTDGLLAAIVFVVLALNAGKGWWWADPLAGFVLAYYGARDATQALFGD